MLIVALLFFAPVVFEYIFDYLSDSVEIAIMGILLSLFFFISLFVWSEQAYDEREESQQLHMNKWAFIVGGVSVIVIIIYQSFT